MNMSINDMKALRHEYLILAEKLRQKGLKGAAEEAEKQASYWADMEIDAWDSAAQRQRSAG